MTVQKTVRCACGHLDIYHEMSRPHRCRGRHCDCDVFGVATYRRSYPHPHDPSVHVIDEVDRDGQLVGTRNVRQSRGLTDAL